MKFSELGSGSSPGHSGRLKDFPSLVFNGPVGYSTGMYVSLSEVQIPCVLLTSNTLQSQLNLAKFITEN